MGGEGGKRLEGSMYHPLSMQQETSEDLTMWRAARILEGIFYALSLVEGYVVVQRMEK